MNAPLNLTKIQRQALLKLLATPEATPIREKGIPRATEIRRLATDGLDNKAIAAATGATISSVSTVVARMRRSFGVKLRRRDTSSIGMLIKLPDEARGRLQSEATRRGIGPSTLVHQLLEVIMRGDSVSKLLGESER